MVTREKPTEVFLFGLYSSEVFRLMHQVLYNTSESGQFGFFIWIAAHESFGSINHSSPLQFGWHDCWDSYVMVQSSPWTQTLILYCPGHLNHDDYYVGKIVPFIPNCMGVSGTSIQICCVTSASSSVVILHLFSFYFFHSFRSNWGGFKAKPQNPIDFKFVLSKRRLK